MRPAWIALVAACSGEAPQPPVAAPSPAPAAPAAPAPPTEGIPKATAAKDVPLPSLALAAPTQAATVPAPIPRSDALLRARAVLEKAVVDHGRDPENPWAVGHAMLALGAEIELPNGRPAVDHLFEGYGEFIEVAGERGVRFPRRRGDVRVEPHSDLLLKAITEGGVSPDRPVAVQGQPATPAMLYRGSLHRAWVNGKQTSFDNLNDTPWSLQALSAWAPPGAAWTAMGGHAMTLTGWTAESLSLLEAENAALMSAKSRGVMPKKDGKGILSYTCGGQHLFQGVAHGVARGFGPADAQPRICAQKDLLLWRIDHELGSVDPILAERGSDRALAIVLLDQRLKFLGHLLESVGKVAAYGTCPWTDEDRRATERAGAELARTVDALVALKVFDDLQAVRNDRSLDPYRPNSGGAEQVYLDLVGDAAHAVRGIDLMLGDGVVRF